MLYNDYYFILIRTVTLNKATSLPQGASRQLHKDFRGDSSAVPSSDQSQWSSQLLHEERNLGLDRFPHEPDGNKNELVGHLVISSSKRNARVMEINYVFRSSKTKPNLLIIPVN